MTVTTEVTTCPIWGSKYEARGVYCPRDKTYEVSDSKRTFYGYRVSKELVESLIMALTDRQKAQLTTWIINESYARGYDPEVTHDVVVSTTSPRRSLPVHKRADRLLKILAWASSTHGVGEVLRFPGSQYELFAWSESVSWSEVQYFLDYLVTRGWLEPTARGVPNVGWKVTVDGHTRVEESDKQEQSTDSSQAFVAMWFDNSMSGAYNNGIELAIRDTGYEPLRIDQKEHINKIDDEIIAEIRRSRFLVADFTHGGDGARGGVYYEAGFAHGLDIPVIFTCRKDAVDTLHFDTNHYNHIVWTDPTDLREKLKHRILAAIGEGPDSL